MGQRSSIQILSVIQSASEEQIENFLLNENVDWNVTDAEGRNALHIAAGLGRTKVVSLLLKHTKLDIDSVDVHGNTPLHISIFTNHQEVANFLLDKNANIDKQNNGGMTAIHWAIHEKHIDCVKLLVDRGASLELKNSKGLTAYDIAQTVKKSFREPLLNILLGRISKSTLKVEVKPINPPTTQEKQIAGLITLWGLIKYAHPHLSYRTDINWDKALLDVIGKILEIGDVNEPTFFNITDQMLRQLKDPNTYVEYEAESVSLPQNPVVPLTTKSNQRPQPFVDITSNNVAVIVTTDYVQLAKYEKRENLTNAFNSALNSANSIVFDVRCLTTPANLTSYGSLFSIIFQDAFRILLKEDLYLPTKRQSLYCGYPEHKISHGRMFFRGLMTLEPEVIPSLAEEPSFHSHIYHKLAPKPMTFIVDRNTPYKIISLILSLQAAQLCTFVYHVDLKDIRKFNDGEQLIFEPGIACSVFELGSSKVFVRLNETLNIDNSVGFHPDLIVTKGEEYTSFGIEPDSDVRFKDPVVKLAIDLVSKKIASRRKKPFIPPIKRRLDSVYAEMSIPPPEFRLLALSRLWNALNYFYPYKSLINKSFQDILLEHIQKFLKANSSLEYSIAILELLGEIHDSHAYVNSDSVMHHVGTHVPLLKLKLVENKAIITHVFERKKKDENELSIGMAAGDIVEQIDGQTVEERLHWLSRLFSSSTIHGQHVQLVPLLLAGKEGSSVKLNLKTKNKEGGYIDKTVEIPRIAVPQSLRIPTPERPYQILTQLDTTGGSIGYVDLRYLAQTQADIAMEFVKNTTSLILDLRGYTKGSMSRLSKYLTMKKVQVAQSKTPFFVPTLLVDGLDPTFNVAPTNCLGGDASIYYKGAVVALIDSSTISHGEHSCLILQACRPDTVFVGSTTAGALGNITNLILPGNIEVGFTSLGYSTPDGKLIQQEGIVPAIFAKETIDKVINGEDEILEAALNYLQTKK